MADTERVRRQVIQRLESLERAGVAQVRKVPRAAKASPAPAPTAASLSPPPPAGARSKPLPAERPASAPAANPAAPPAAASPSLPPEIGLEIIRLEVAGCTRCPQLAATRTKTVFGVGNIRPRLAFLGEAPGADEDAQGEPFVGRAGQLLTKIIEACRLKREEVYILNVLKCRPPEN